tara:strand:- start:407 stop:736 length:330 start_codon:yes stop_codon:yes gene_type:complete
MNNKLTCVEWLDSVEYADADWKSEEEVKELQPMIIKSAGMLVNETDIYITLASSINNADDKAEPRYGGLLSIPKTAIKRRCSLPTSFTSETMSQQMKEIQDGIWPGPGV